MARDILREPVAVVVDRSPAIAEDAPDLVRIELDSLATTTFMDYLVPRAAEMPDIEIHSLETPSEFGWLGANGLDESGTSRAPAALLNAISNALRMFGKKAVKIPVTSSHLTAILPHNFRQATTREDDEGVMDRCMGWAQEYKRQIEGIATWTESAT